MEGIGAGLQSFFNFAIVCFILAICGICYFIYSILDKDGEIVSPTRITPELQLIVKDNKIDTLFVYKLKK